MATQTTGGGSTTSFTNTPQANGDTYNYIEDVLYDDATLYDRDSKTVFLDVMSNDLGGKAKTLFSVDDGGTGALTDLLKVETAWEQTADKNWIRVYNGKIEFKIGDGSDCVANARDVNTLDTDDSVDDTFVYAIRMANGTLAWATVHITIAGENDGPITGGDGSASGSEDDASIGGNVPSATDIDGDTLTYHLVAGSVEVDGAAAPDGTVTLNADGSYSYDPSGDQGLDDGESRTITFRYVANDGDEDSAEATITITVNGANDAPVSGGDDSASGSEDDASIGGTVPAASDVDVEDLTYHLVPGSVLVDGEAAPDGTVTLNADGTYSYTPTAGDQGLDTGEHHTITFDYVANDGTADSDAATVTITVNGVNDAPTSSDGSGSTDEDTPLESSLPAAADIDGETVEYALDTQAAHGSVVVNADGTFTYTPGENYHGDDSFTFTVSDGDASNTYTYDITVNSVNDAPVLTGTQATLADGIEDTAFFVSTADLLSGFTDVDGDILAVDSLVANHGTITAAVGGYTITPTGDYNGTVTLSYNVVDGHGGSVPAQLTFDLAEVNDAAVIGGTDEGEITEDADPNTVSGTLTASDVDNAPNTFQASSGNTTYGSFVMGANGQWTYTLNNGNAAVNNLAVGGVLLDSFVVKSEDGTEHTVEITIHGADDGPSFPSTWTGLDSVNDHDSDLGAGSGGSPILAGATEGDDTLNGRTGGSGQDTINALGGDDTVNAGDGGDNVYAGEGSDHVYGGEGNDTLYGQAGNDFLYGQGGNDSLFGGSGDDYLEGLGGNDMVLNGGSGNDTIVGGAFSDLIIGGYGADTLTGGGGADTFKFEDIKDTNDTILDYLQGGNDVIDLSGIDADPLSAISTFVWGGTTPTAGTRALSAAVTLAVMSISGTANSTVPGSSTTLICSAVVTSCKAEPYCMMICSIAKTRAPSIWLERP